jgi:hypothetical protein
MPGKRAYQRTAGHWNQDGEFNSADLIAARVAGHYVGDAFDEQS